MTERWNEVESRSTGQIGVVEEIVDRWRVLVRWMNGTYDIILITELIDRGNE